MGVCGLLLAAGAGTRFAGHTHKLLAPLRGRPVWEWSLEHLVVAGLPHIVVVTGAVDLPLPEGVVRCRHSGWADGQGSSLVAGIRVAADLGADAVVVGLADQPFVTPEAWRTVAHSPCDIAVATYDGVRGPHPVRLARTVWPLLRHADTRGDDHGDEGARSLLREHPELVCEVPCLGSAADIDTLEDLERWRSC